MRRACPSSWAGMHKLATAPRRSSESTSARTSPAAAADWRSVRRAGRTRCSKCARRGSKAEFPECRAGASPRLAAINAAYRCIQRGRRRWASRSLVSGPGVP